MVDEISIENKVNVLAVGIHGRKKEDTDLTICGSTVATVCVDPVAPILVCKILEEREDKIGGRFNFMACVDGSKESLKALKEGLRLMNYETDFLEVIHVKKFSITSESVNSMVEKFLLSENFKNYKFTALEWCPSESRDDTILNYVHDAGTDYVDFFVASNHGTGAGKHTGKYIGRVAKGLVEKARTNVFIVI